MTQPDPERTELCEKLKAALNEGTPDESREDFEQLCWVNRFAILDALTKAAELGTATRDYHLKAQKYGVRIASLERDLQAAREENAQLSAILDSFVPQREEFNI
jgi:hypothetical protein